MNESRNGRYDEWHALMLGVIIQAIADAKGDDMAKSLDAALWLTSSDLPLWLEAVGLPDVDALAFVTTGAARKSKIGSVANG
jgi:hypothetical protein